MLNEEMLPVMSKYKVELNYGYTDEEDGIYHSFVTADPDGERAYGPIESRLASLLDVDPFEDERFAWNTMDVAIPQSVVDRIKADAIAEYEAEKAVDEFKAANDRAEKAYRKLRTVRKIGEKRKRRF